MKLALATQGSQAEPITVSDHVFGQPFREALVHQVVTAYLAAGRSGTKKQKTRAEVRGGGAKPWRQKGTGRARAGTIRSPLWRTGGVIFAARPKDWAQKVNKKMYRGAMRDILSELLRQNRLHVLETFEIAELKTKLFVQQLKANQISQGLLVVKAFEEKLFLAARNVPDVCVQEVRHVNPVELLKYDQVWMTVEALRVLEEKLDVK